MLACRSFLVQLLRALKDAMLVQIIGRLRVFVPNHVICEVAVDPIHPPLGLLLPTIHVRIGTVDMDNAGFKDQAHTVCATQDTQVQVATDLSPEIRVRIATVDMDNAGLEDQAHTVCATLDTQVQIATELCPQIRVRSMIVDQTDNVEFKDQQHTVSVSTDTPAQIVETGQILLQSQRFAPRTSWLNETVGTLEFQG